jgi:hypothetical protein
MMAALKRKRCAGLSESEEEEAAAAVCFKGNVVEVN